VKRFLAVTVIFSISGTLALGPSANAYLTDTTVPDSGGCPQLNRWNLSLAEPLSRQWSTSLPAAQTLFTSASSGDAQLSEIEQAISDSFAAWSGVTGTTFNTAAHPGYIAPLTRITAASACTNDQETDIDGVNTICFDQSSMGFTSGVLAFTRVITANAPGVSVGSGPPAAFAGQILDADTLVRNDGQATFATPAVLGTPQAPGAYDLESILIHEIGHWFGFDHSAVWRSIMFPFAPPPGQFLGDRVSTLEPDGPLADDDRAGIRMLYPDPSEAINIGSIRGRVLPANPFALATQPAPSVGRSVTGIFGAHVVAVDASNGAVIAGALAGWSCDPANPPAQFGGSFDIERLPVGRSYVIYAEPLDGLVGAGDISNALDSICSSSTAVVCATPVVNVNFNPRIQPGP
jgi:Matrixin